MAVARHPVARIAPPAPPSSAPRARASGGENGERVPPAKVDNARCRPRSTRWLDGAARQNTKNEKAGAALDPTQHQRGCHPARRSNPSAPRQGIKTASASRKIGRESSTLRVHPRACGEHVSQMEAAWLRPGSSPRVRGTLRSSSVDAALCGSSPRVRGTTSVSARASADMLRFIPARAGNTLPRTSASRRSAVHPRACGEHTRRARCPQRRDRFIPARAGNAAGYPTACVAGNRFIPARAGNARRLRPTCVGLTGSSPRVRGTPTADLDRATLRYRFIPARAGNAVPSASR